MANIEPLTDPTAFVDVLAKSGLVTDDTIARVRSSAESSGDAMALAKSLIKEGTLTRWQAGQLLRQYSALTLGPYRLLDQLGKGPTGRVYLAEHGKLGKKVSLRVLPGRFSAQPQVLKRFLDEANRAGALNHRNLIHIFDVGNDGEKYYLSVEYVDGRDFQRLVEASGRLPPAQAIDLVRQVADGLAHAHEQELTHGDLKPSSLLVDASGVVKIMDLGLSGLADNPIAGDGVDESTESPTLASLAFRAPELLSSNQRSDVRSDLYSLGAVLYFLLTGKPPSRNAAEVAGALDKVPAITPELANLCDHLLAANPGERPESSAQVAAALELVGRAAGAIEKMPERSAADRPSSAGKAKRPLIAKPLEDVAQAAVTVTAEESADDSDNPLGGFAIKTGRKRKSPHAMSAVNVAMPAADAVSIPPAARSGARMPLILAAAIGGGLLAIALVVTVAILVLNRVGTTEVATAPDAKSAAQAISAETIAASQGDDKEAIPEVNPEANPDAAAGVADQEKGTATEESTATANAKGPDPAKPEAPPMTLPPATTAQPTKTEPAKTEPTKAEPAKTEPAKTEPAKTEPAKTEPAKTEPAKTAPAPAAPAANPFQGFAATVSLPPLEAMGKPAPDALTPATLGPVMLEPGALCLIKLKGGETAFKSGVKFLLEPAKQGTAERDWEFKLQEGTAEPPVVATMSLKENQLTFQWTEEATKHQAAPYLCNCVLSMAAGPGTHQVAMRKVVIVEPISAAVGKGTVNEKVMVEYAPSGKQIAVEFGPLEGGPPKHKIDPKLELSAFKDTTYLFAGNSDDALYLGFKIDVSMSAKTLQIVALPQYFIPGAMVKPDRFLRNTPAKLGDLVGAGLQQANFKANLAKQIKDNNKKKKAEEMAKGEVDLAQKGMAQVEQLKEIAAAMDEGAKLHFRASYLAEDVKVELVNTGGPPPGAAPAAKPADAPKK